MCLRMTCVGIVQRFRLTYRGKLLVIVTDETRVETLTFGLGVYRGQAVP